MAETELVSADEITRNEVQALQGKYADLIVHISDLKGAKPGQKSLRELDQYRYEEAPSAFSIQAPSKKQLGLNELKSLVEWKLRHGKFRPTLMNLISQNSSQSVTQSIQAGISSYSSSKDPLSAIAEFSKLRGVGPATASLLLAVHDPDNVIFFSDEAFWWLCCGGEKKTVKYNTKEYQLLLRRVHEVSERLRCGASTLERVAFVVMRQESGPADVFDSVTGNKDQTLLKQVDVGGRVGKPPNKRKKQSADATAAKAVGDLPLKGVRRSKRQKN